jgi:hypothetical protein
MEKILKKSGMMRILLFGGFLLGIISQNINATEQYPDIIVHNGIEYEIGVYPMETYYKIYPYRRPLRIIRNTALWRGYRARYEIMNNELILIGVQTLRLNGEFGRLSKKRMKVKTFSGKMNLFNGEHTGV